MFRKFSLGRSMTMSAVWRADEVGMVFAEISELFAFGSVVVGEDEDGEKGLF